MSHTDADRETAAANSMSMSGAQALPQAGQPTLQRGTGMNTAAAAAAAATTTRMAIAGPAIKAVFFDFMGTCLDWHSTVVRALPPGIPEAVRSRLALDWREEFFSELHMRSRQGLPPEDIDVTHRRTLLRLLQPQHAHHESRCHFFEAEEESGAGGLIAGTEGSSADDDGEQLSRWPVVEQAVASWHHMAAWDDVLPALAALRDELGLELFVLANGTTRLQLDLARSSGLGGLIDMLFSSELLGVYKPAPEAYERALALVKARPDQAVMVAAHAYDLRAAKALGMHTVYVYRWTDDATEDMDVVRRENEHFLAEGGMRGLVDAITTIMQ